jgi:hypothetical protein
MDGRELGAGASLVTFVGDWRYRRYARHPGRFSPIVDPAAGSMSVVTRNLLAPRA